MASGHHDLRGPLDEHPRAVRHARGPVVLRASPPVRPEAGAPRCAPYHRSMPTVRVVGTRRGRSRWSRLLAAVGICAAAVAMAEPSGAVAEIQPVPEATGYDYSAGEPAIWGSVGGTVGAYYDKACTGGYAIAGDSGWFLTSAAMCPVMLAADGSIRGDAGYHADRFAERAGDPTVLLRMRPGNDAHQLLVDPITGAVPGDGRVVGWTPSVDQRPRLSRREDGDRHRVDRGTRAGHSPWAFRRAAALHGRTRLFRRRRRTGVAERRNWPAGPRDRRRDQRPRRRLLSPHPGDAVPVRRLPPVFGPDQGRPSWGTFAPGMPSYGGAVEVTYVGRIIDKGDDWRP
jgi:hypothetical protein